MHPAKKINRLNLCRFSWIISLGFRSPSPRQRTDPLETAIFQTDTKTDTKWVKLGIARLSPVMLDSLVKSAILNCFRGDNSPIPTLASS